MLVGPETAFRPGTFEPTIIWIFFSFVTGLLAAIAAGFICVVIAKNKKASLWLAGLVLVIGLSAAVYDISNSVDASDGTRAGDVSMEVAMQQLKQPTWVKVLIPIIGAIGVIAGGRLKNWLAVDRAIISG